MELRDLLARFVLSDWRPVFSTLSMMWVCVGLQELFLAIYGAMALCDNPVQQETVYKLKRNNWQYIYIFQTHPCNHPYIYIYIY